MTLSALGLVTVVLTHFSLKTPKGLLANSADPDQTQIAASDQILHYLQVV